MTPKTELQAPGGLADAINSEHRAVEVAARSALTHAMRAGELLTEAKLGVAHGQWGVWLAEHFEGSERTAQVYMRVHEHRGELEANPQRVADLSLREAARLLAAPKHESPETREELLISTEAEIRQAVPAFLRAGDRLRQLQNDSPTTFDAFCNESGIDPQFAKMAINSELELAISRAN